MATELQDGHIEKKLRSSTGDNPPPSEHTGSIHGPAHRQLLDKDSLIITKMPRRCKNPQQTHKLSSYFVSLQRNGDGAREQQPDHRPRAHDDRHGMTSTTPHPTKPPSESSSGTSSPSTRSPAKSKLWRDSPTRPQVDPNMEVSGPHNNTTGQDIQGGDPIADLPTAGRPISDTMLKEMLLSLQSSLQADMVRGINKFKREGQANGHRVDHVESKME